MVDRLCRRRTASVAMAATSVVVVAVFIASRCPSVALSVRARGRSLIRQLIGPPAAHRQPAAASQAPVARAQPYIRVYRVETCECVYAVASPAPVAEVADCLEV